MPQTVKKLVKVNDLRKGDVFADDETRVTDIVKKQIWAVIGSGNDARRMRLTDEIFVLRSEPTEAEIEQRRRDMIRETLHDELASMLKNTPVQMLEDIVTKARQDEASYGRPTTDVLTWSNLPGVLKTQALYKIGVRINAILNDYVGQSTLADATHNDLVTAFAAWYAQDVDKGYRTLGSNPDPTSRSTSPISNMLEDLDEWAKKEVLTRFSFALAHEPIMRRAAELRAEWDERSKSTWKK